MSRALSLLPNFVKASSEMIGYVQAKQSIIIEEAQMIAINPRDLELQVLLHLPRLMYGDSYPAPEDFTKEVKRLASVMHNRVNPYEHWRTPPAMLLTNPHDTTFVDVSEEDARIIQERFHYLSSVRLNSFSYGLETHDHRLASLITLSPFDLDHTKDDLPIGVKPSNVMVVSRVFCFDWAPWNAVSYMMGQMYKRLRCTKPNVKMLLTYINPNLAFKAASLRASNWVMFGYEEVTRYAYINNAYITDRHLVREYGTADPERLREILGEQFEASSLHKVRLDPLQLYAHFLDRDLYMLYTDGFKHEFRRP
jgi:hypothetical protein